VGAPEAETHGCMEAASSTQCAPNLASSHGVLGIFWIELILSTQVT
jgi:hypothetical protein